MLSGVGLGFRSEIASDLLQARGCVDFVEFVAEAHLCTDGRREAIAVGRTIASVVHAVKLSLGSAEGFDKDRVCAVGTLAKETGALAIGEHMSFSRAGGREIGHLTALPMTREAVRVLVKNVNQARCLLPDVPFLLENVAWTFRWRQDEMTEADFVNEVAERTGCPLLLDVSNLYANAINRGNDPVEAIAKYPLERVAMVHMAGGIEEQGFYFDTHAHPVPDGAFALLPHVFARAGDVPVLIERDANFPRFEDLVAETDRARSHFTGRTLPRRDVPSPQRTAGPIAAPLARDQAEVARLLTEDSHASDATLLVDGGLALARARRVLHRRRESQRSKASR
jgi:uncharacterized protein (UPF0276 family)